jgi:Tetratricopeptide repeat
VLEGLGALVEHSLLQSGEGTDGEPRFTMLETIREYAVERLLESEEEAALRQRHAQYYLTLAETAEPLLRGPEQAVWLERLVAEYDNLRAVLAWSTATPTAGTLGLRLAGALWWFWYRQGLLSEARAWFDAVLASPHARAQPAARVKALWAAGHLALFQSDYARARALLADSLALGRAVGDASGVAYALTFAGYVELLYGDAAAQQALFDEGVARLRAGGDRWGLALALNGLSVAALFRGEPQVAAERLEESVTLFRALDDHWGLAMVLTSLAHLVLGQGDAGRARAHYQESLALVRATGDRYLLLLALMGLGFASGAQRDDAQAVACFGACLPLVQEVGKPSDGAAVLQCLAAAERRLGHDRQALTHLAASLARLHAGAAGAANDDGGVVRLFQRLGPLAGDSDDEGRRSARALAQEPAARWLEQESTQGIAACLVGLAGAAAARGNPARAARLLAASEALLEAVQTRLAPAERLEAERHAAAARAQLDEATFAVAWAEGRAWSLEHAIAEALDGVT